MQSTNSRHKVCTKCSLNIPVENFYKRADRDTLSSWCKKCRSEYNARRYLSKREDMIAQAKSWHRENPDAWKKRRPQTKLERQTRRWNGRFKTSGHVSIDQVRSRFEAFGNKCWMCQAEGELDIDHVKPRSIGGPHVASNIRPACKECNRRKSNKWFGVSRLNEFIKK